MADKATPLVNSFNGGEVSPRIDARSDIAKYYSGCRTLQGMVPYTEGGTTRMPGTYFVQEVKMSSKRSRIVPFHFSTIQAYAIEFGDQYIRFYMDDGIILDGATVYEIASPYLEADLFRLKFCQSADVMYIFHPSYPPKKLTRTSHILWTLTDFQAKVGVPMAITGITKAATAVVTCTTVPTTLATGDIVHIQDVAGMTEVNDLFFTMGAIATGAGGTFELASINSTGYGAWSAGGTAQECVFGTPSNRPSCGAFFGQRLILAGSANFPQRLDISASGGDYEEFDQDANDDAAALQYTLASGKIDRIRWMIGEDTLLLGTTGGIWKFVIPTTPTTSSPNALKHIHIGVQDIEAKAVGGFIFWVTRSGLSLRQLVYDFGSDKYIPPDMTRLARHIALGTSIPTSGIIEMDYQQEPLPILWAVRADGQLLGFVADLQEKVFAWFRVVTDGKFESVAVISRDGQEDQVWVVVNRTIGEVTRRYVEYFTPHEFYSTIENCFFVHSGLSYNGGLPANIAGISKAATAVVTIEAWPTDGVELIDFAAAGWNEDGVKWKFLAGNLDHTNTDATAVTATLGATIVAGHAYKVVLKGTGGGAACAYTLGGTAGSAIPNSGAFTITDYITAANAGLLVITPGATSTVSFSSISVQELDYILAAGNKVNIAEVVGMTEVNKDNLTAHTVGTVSIANRTFELSGVDSSAYMAWASGGEAKIVVNGFAAPDLLHLAGKTVDALVDGVADVGHAVASDGALTPLTYYGNQIHVGLPYVSDVEPMKLNAGSQAGTARGKKQRINKVTCCFFETGEGVTVGPSAASMKEVMELEAGVLNTVDLPFSFFSDWGDEATLYVRQTNPLPMTILALVPRVSLNED